MRRLFAFAVAFVPAACASPSLPVMERGFARGIDAPGLVKDEIYTASLEWLNGYSGLRYRKNDYRDKKTGKLIYNVDMRADLTSLQKEKIGFVIDITAGGGNARFECNNPRTTGLSFWWSVVREIEIDDPDEVENFKEFCAGLADSYEKYLNSKTKQ
jgi:hypothetical protein